MWQLTKSTPKQRMRIDAAFVAANARKGSQRGCRVQVSATDFNGEGGERTTVS
jgi:hypothetical protein